MGKVLVVNKGYSDNLGDQAINFSIVSYFQDKGFEVEFQDLTFSKKEDKTIQTLTENLKKREGFKDFLHTIKLYKVLWSIKNIRKIIKASSQKYELVIIGGGQLVLSNVLFPIAVFLWSFCLSWFNQKFFFLSVGIGEKFSFLEKLMYKYSLSKARNVYVRDTKSRELCKLYFNVEKCQICPDAAVLFPVEKYNQYEKELIKTTLIGIVDYRVYQKYNKDTIDKEQYYEMWYNKYVETEVNNVNLFYTTTNDLHESRNFQMYIENKYGVEMKIIDIKVLEDVVKVFAQSHKVVSGRMHALLLGKKFRCELIPFEISHKIRMFSKEYAYADYVDLREQLSDVISERIIQE